MRHRVPTVVLDTPVAREVYGDGARYVAAGDAPGLAAELVRLVTDAEHRRACIAAGDTAVAGYRWDDTARLTWQALVDAAGGRR
jgi:glycosyltransferase involved in cell wall biosynthesis